MAKFHINPETGEPGRCTALRQCRYGGSAAHYTSKEEAREAFEVTQEALTSFKKETNRTPPPKATPKKPKSFANPGATPAPGQLAMPKNTERYVIVSNYYNDEGRYMGRGFSSADTLDEASEVYDTLLAGRRFTTTTYAIQKETEVHEPVEEAEEPVETVANDEASLRPGDVLTDGPR